MENLKDKIKKLWQWLDESDIVKEYDTDGKCWNLFWDDHFFFLIINKELKDEKSFHKMESELKDHYDNITGDQSYYFKQTPAGAHQT